MKFKYKNRKKRALFLSVNSIKTHLQRKQVFASMISSTLFEMNIRRRRSVWAYQREDLWFDSMLTDQIFEQHWGSDFHMSRGTFQDIVRVVQPALKKRDTLFQRAIPIEMRVAITLWRLSTGNSFRTVAKTFAVGKSTAVQITREFCSEILRLAPRYIHFHRSRRETAEAIEQFKVFCQCRIPQVLGALDGTQIPIVAPKVDGKADYFSRKQRYTISIQGLVGANLLFLDVATGFPGSCHDNTSLYTQETPKETPTQMCFLWIL